MLLYDKACWERGAAPVRDDGSRDHVGQCSGNGKTWRGPTRDGTAPSLRVFSPAAMAPRRCAAADG